MGKFKKIDKNQVGQSDLTNLTDQKVHTPEKPGDYVAKSNSLNESTSNIKTMDEYFDFLDQYWSIFPAPKEPKLKEKFKIAIL